VRNERGGRAVWRCAHDRAQLLLEPWEAQGGLHRRRGGQRVKDGGADGSGAASVIGSGKASTAKNEAHQARPARQISRF